MRTTQLTVLDSLAGLRANVEAWDDLWQRSDVTTPLSRAELIAQWVEHFAPSEEFRALVVQEDGTWVAALPLVSHRLLRVLNAGTPPINSWLPGGRGLLLDSRCDEDRAMNELAVGLSRLPWNLLWLDEAPLDTRPWTALRAAFARKRMPTSMLDRYRVARIDIEGSWEDYTRSWSRGFRKHISRTARRLEELGDVRLETISSFSAEAGGGE